MASSASATPRRAVGQAVQADDPQAVRPRRGLSDRQRLGELPLRRPAARRQVGVDTGEVAQAAHGKQGAFEEQRKVKSGHSFASCRGDAATPPIRPAPQRIRMTGRWPRGQGEAAADEQGQAEDWRPSRWNGAEQATGEIERGHQSQPDRRGDDTVQGRLHDGAVLEVGIPGGHQHRDRDARQQQAEQREEDAAGTAPAAARSRWSAPAG